MSEEKAFGYKGTTGDEQMTTEEMLKMAIEKMVSGESMTREEIQSLSMGKGVSIEAWNRMRLENGLISSQKASALAAYDTHFTYGRMYATPKTLFMLNDDDIEDAVHWMNNYISKSIDMFTRTCPLTPRHGVLESTRSKGGDADELRETVSHLQNVMLEHDPEGCLMIQPFTDAVGSCVLAPDMYVVIGEGHDGITAGHGFRMALPLRSAGEHGVNRHFRKALEVMSNKSGHEYDPTKHEIEMVFDHKWDGTDMHHSTYDINSNSYMNILLTQIRGCDEHTPIGTPPSGVSINGSVPLGEVTVTQVWVMEGLEEVIWLEENITKEKCPEGFVVSEPNGSMLSHINAHCRTHGIPYIIGDVEEGQVWKEVGNGWVVEDTEGNFVAEPYNPFDYIEEFRSGIEYGNSHWRRKHAYLSTFFHQWMGQPMSDPAFTAYLAGIFASWMVKASIAACVGEMRHSASQKKNRCVDVALFVLSVFGLKRAKKAGGNNAGRVPQVRDEYHTWMKDTVVDWSGASKVLALCDRYFATGWNSSYGGKAWAGGAQMASKVADLIAQVMSEDDVDTLRDVVGPALVSSVNALENAQHNNGNLLNKFGGDIVTAYDNGTSGFREDYLYDAFATYCMAKDIHDDALSGTEQGQENDWHLVCDWFLTNGNAKFWRKNPVYTVDWESHPSEMPECIQDVVKHMSAQWYNWSQAWSHASNSHSYKATTQSSYIPCGHTDCKYCLAWENYNNAPEALNPVGVEQTTPTAEFDVWELKNTQTQETGQLRVVTDVRALLASGETITMEQVIDVFAKAHEKGDTQAVAHHIGMILADWHDTADVVAVVEAMNKITAQQEGA